VSAPRTLGVAGAGTMGAGIAQLGAAAGMRTLLHDPVPEALERGLDGARAGLAKWAEKGRAEATAADLLEAAPELDGLAECDLVIEAAPERPELKRELFDRLSSICADDTVLATNTSSIPVTSLANAAARPDRVVGMHFFNPPPLMPLLEVIRADQSSDDAVAVAEAAGEAMGKRVIIAADGPGFLVNRCGRPFMAEALRVVQEGVATPAQVDRICRLGGGFRMGPFELMDLIGIDVGLEVAKSFMELSFGEPRWKPSPLQARMVAAGRLGRKAGRGWYEYGGEGPYRPEDPEPREPAGGAGKTVTILGEGRVAADLRELANRAGFEVAGSGPAQGDLAGLVIDAQTEAAPSADLMLCADASLASREATRAVGFNFVPPRPRLVELTALPGAEGGDEAEAFFAALGLETEWVGDSPGLVLGRIVCQLVNEAAFAIAEGVGSPEDMDAGLELGLSFPRGAVGWAGEIGLDAVLATVDGLWAERREERYRAAPLLRRAIATGGLARTR
jgi:3-hydroxybutyryl-CoA dehydrogenase